MKNKKKLSSFQHKGFLNPSKSSNIGNILLSFLFFSLLQLVFFSSNPVYAHKVSTYAYREGDKIFGECYFVDGSPCKNSKVEIYNARGDKILETTTDEKGKYSFTITEKGTLRIVISAGEGHKAKYKLEGIGGETVKKETPLTQHHPSINKDEIKQIIEEAMDAKFSELKTEIINLHKQMDKVTLRDLIGGIGYIFGVWGIITLLKNKKNAS
jgi:nickel transport protein